MAIITVPKALRDKLGDEGSDALIEVINHSQSNQKADIIELVGEKFERRLSEEIAGVNQSIERLRTELKQDNANLRAELKKDNANLRAELKQDNGSLHTELKKDNTNLRTELKQDNANLRTELKQDNANLRTEMHALHASVIKWMFIFWVGQVVTILGVLFAFFR